MMHHDPTLALINRRSSTQEKYVTPPTPVRVFMAVVLFDNRRTNSCRSGDAYIRVTFSKNHA